MLLIALLITFREKNKTLKHENEVLQRTLSMSAIPPSKFQWEMEKADFQKRIKDLQLRLVRAQKDKKKPSKCSKK